MQDMIKPMIVTRLFYRNEIVRLLDDANYRTITRRRRAEPARVNIGQVIADRAENNFLFDLSERPYETFDIGLRHPQDMKRETLRGFVTDSRQALKLVY